MNNYVISKSIVKTDKSNWIMSGTANNINDFIVNTMEQDYKRIYINPYKTAAVLHYENKEKYFIFRIED